MQLIKLKTRVERLASKIDAPTHLLPTYHIPRGDALPHIEYDTTGQFHFVVSERGQELKRKTTTEENEILYWIFSSITYYMATAYELKHRNRNQDCKRMIYSKQEVLLGLIDPKWGQRIHLEHQYHIEQHPFDDFMFLRMDYTDQLKEQGYTELEIRNLVAKKYPKKSPKTLRYRSTTTLPERS